MTLEDLIAEVAFRHLRINNLFQLENGRWQANLTDGERFWEFGRGETAISALQAALDKHLTTEPELGIKQVDKAYNPPKKPKLSNEAAADLLKGAL